MTDLSLPIAPGAASGVGGASPLRLVMLGHASVGGSARAAVRLAEALVDCGHAVVMASLHPLAWPMDPRICQAVLKPARTVAPDLYAVWTPGEVSAMHELLCATCRESGAHIVHAHYAHPFGHILARGLPRGVRSLLTLHGTDLDRLTSSDVAELQRLEHCTAVSAAMTRRAQSLGLRCTHVPNLIPADWPPTSTNRPNRRPKIIHVSNFRQVKDHDLLIIMLNAILNRTDASVTLVGDGPEHANVVRGLKGNIDAGRVTICGAVADPAPYIAASDMMLLTSRSESFSLAALEALACGVPVAAPALPGLSELLRDGREGVLFDRTDPETAVERICAALASPQLLARLSAAGRHTAAAYRSDRIAPRYEAVYRRMCVAA